eukprot:scaffold1785_cov95-Isochrysis_galbana.AAC.5
MQAPSLLHPTERATEPAGRGSLVSFTLPSPVRTLSSAAAPAPTAAACPGAVGLVWISVAAMA